MARVIAIDFETYFDSKSYSLTRMGPLSYIRDPRFRVLCVGVRVDRGPTHVIEEGLAAECLAACRLDDPDTFVVGHNIAGFDALILSERYGIRPAHILDTIPMMHWLGLSRIIPCSHKALTALLGHGVKRAGTVVSDGKASREDFTPDEWEFFRQYCADDVTQCSDNFLSMIQCVTSPDALSLMDLTARMATEPAFVPDGAAVDRYIVELDAASERARRELAAFLRFPDTESMLKAIRSPKRFPELLRGLGAGVPMKPSEKRGCDIPAISKADVAFLRMADDPDPRVAALVRARLEQNSSIHRSRAARLASPALRDRPVPILLGAYKAHTGRYTAGGEGASDGLNFQNFSKRDPSQLALRRALRVAPGQRVVACDSSQVEARILAWVSGQDDLVEQFRGGRDPYAEMASKIFGEPSDLIHDAAKDSGAPDHDRYKMHRNVGKTLVLSAGYGVGAAKLADTLLRQGIRLDPDRAAHDARARDVHALYRRASYAIVGFWRACEDVLRGLAANPQDGIHGAFGREGIFRYGRYAIPCTTRVEPCVELPNGYRLWYPGLRMGADGRMEYDRADRKAPSKIYGGLLAENVCQALAFHMLAWQACRMAEHGVPIKCNIHDAWIAVVPEGRAEETLAIMERDMSRVPAWLEGFPVGCEGEIGIDFTIA